MRLGPLRLLITGTASGIALWAGFDLLTGVGEPWDHQLFMGAYALSVAVAALIGAFAASHAWIAGVAITLSMLPVMMLISGMGPLIRIGVVLLLALSAPPAAAASIAQRLARKRHA